MQSEENPKIYKELNDFEFEIWKLEFV